MSICRIFNHEFNIEIFISEDWYFISDYYSEFYLFCQDWMIVPLSGQVWINYFLKFSFLH